MISIPEKTFVMLVGPTGCGKTTFREKLPAIPCVNPDSYIVGKWSPEKVKLAWDHAGAMSEILFKEKVSFIFDAQFVTEWVRKHWQAVAKGHGHATLGIIFDTPWDQIQANQKARGSRGAYGEVPLSVQTSSYQSFEAQKKNGTLAAGFDAHVFVEWGKDFSYKGT